ncbi:MAG: hypothetical protein NC084_10195 [Bacteroides sp.]|nr:hypothetical protein [Eubacterium sp.]MCM1419172.1 hypothetical protein [Roseburia sp.]MCM1463069.1 hypothetical protein [Bacteroides sp.]
MSVNSNTIHLLASKSGTPAPSEAQPLRVPRMGTIQQTAELFGLPKHFVRQKVLAGEVVAVRAGKRYLVNLDKFAAYLNGDPV